MSPAAIAALVVLGFAVMLVRRRSLATLLVSAQAMLLGIAALSLARGRPAEFLVAAIILLVRAVALPAFLP